MSLINELINELINKLKPFWETYVVIGMIISTISYVISGSFAMYLTNNYYVSTELSKMQFLIGSWIVSFNILNAIIMIVLLITLTIKRYKKSNNKTNDHT